MQRKRKGGGQRGKGGREREGNEDEQDEEACVRGRGGEGKRNVDEG